MKKIVLVVSLIFLAACQSEPAVDPNEALNATVDAALAQPPTPSPEPIPVQPTLNPAALPTPVISIIGGDTSAVASSTDAAMADAAPISLTEAGIPTDFYYLNASGQIMRVSNGAQTQVSDELSAIVDFKLSPVDNSIALLTEVGDLIQLDFDGQNRTLLATSPLDSAITSMVWGANGRFITYAQNGIKRVPNGGGTSRIVLENDANQYEPIVWSNDGSQLLVKVLGDTDTIGIFAEETVTFITDEQGNSAACCDATFTQSGKSVYVSGAEAFRYNITAGEATNLVSADNSGELLNAQQLDDGDVYGFFAGENGYIFSVLRDEFFADMRSDEIADLSSASWEPRAEGALINSNNEIIWLARNDDPATLVGNGSLPQFALGDPANKVEPLTVSAQTIVAGETISGEVAEFGTAEFVVNAEAGVGQLFVIETGTESADITASILDEAGIELIKTDVGYEWGTEVLYYIPEESSLLSVQIEALAGKAFDYTIRQIEFRYDADNVLIYEEDVFSGGRANYFLDVEAGDKFFIVLETDGFANSILDVLNSSGEYVTFADENSENGPEALYYVAPEDDRLRIELTEYFLGTGSYILTVIDDNLPVDPTLEENSEAEENADEAAVEESEETDENAGEAEAESEEVEESSTTDSN